MKKVSGIIKFYINDQLVTCSEYSTKQQRDKRIEAFLLDIKRLRSNRLIYFDIIPVIPEDAFEVKKGVNGNHYGEIGKRITNKYHRKFFTLPNKTI